MQVLQSAIQKNRSLQLREINAGLNQFSKEQLKGLLSGLSGQSGNSGNSGSNEETKLEGESQ